MILQNKRIFIVEDDLKNRAIAQLLLEREGAKISFERWGIDTISKLKRFLPVDIILLDLMFPRGVTGYDVFKEIRSHSEFRHIPIVAVSAADASIAVPLTKDMGFAGFIAKPIDFHNFTKQISEIIKGVPVWEA